MATERMNSGVTNNPMLILDKDAGENGGGWSSSSSSRRLKVSCRPATPFARKIYEMVKNPQTNAIISWNSEGNGFIIWDAHKFAAQILPCYFKHNNFSSFVCQLNSYGFRKASWEKYEYQHEWFQKGKKRWLKNIQRKTKQTAQKEEIQEQLPGEEMSMTGMEEEIKEMEGEQREIMMEIEQLIKQQQLLAEELADMRKNAPSPEEKRRQLAMLMAEALLESLSELDDNGIMEEIVDPNPVEEVNKATGETESNKLKMVEERPDIVIGLDDLIEGPVDWGNYMKQMI